WLRGRQRRLRCVRPGRRSGSMSSRREQAKRTPIGSASSLGIFWTSCSSSPSSFAVALAVRAHAVVFAGSSRIVILTAGVRVVTRDARVVAGGARVVAGGVRVLARIWGLRAFAGSSRAVGGVVVGRGDRGIGSDELSQHRFPTGR